MSVKTWVLCDVDQDIYRESLNIGPRDVGGEAKGYSVRKRTLRGGLREGVDVIEIDNGAFQFTVLPTRGMGLWRGKLGEMTVGWNSPVKGPVHPRSVRLDEPSGLGWLGGFDELLCRCGLESNGGPDRDEEGRLRYALHGRIANLPAHKVELEIDDSSGEIKLRGTIDESRLYHNKLRLTSTLTTGAGERGVRIVDEVTNLSGEPGQLELLYHVNFGPPILDSGATVVLPAKEVAPCTARAAEGIDGWQLYRAEEAGYTEQVYFFELKGDPRGRTQTLLRNAHGNQGVSLHFNLNELPHFTVWKSTQMAADGYVTGLEPGTNFPNVRSFEEKQGRVITLKPGESRRYELKLELHPDAESVAKAEQVIKVLRDGAEPKVIKKPGAPWSPA